MDFDFFVRKALTKTITVLMAGIVLLLVWDYTNPALVGFTVGTAISALNGYFLALRIKGLVGFNSTLSGECLGDKKGQAKKVKDVLRAGLVVVRWLVVLAILLIGVMTGWFDLLGLMGGLFVLPAFAIGGALLVLLRQDLNKCKTY